MKQNEVLHKRQAMLFTGLGYSGGVGSLIVTIQHILLDMKAKAVGSREKERD